MKFLMPYPFAYFYISKILESVSKGCPQLEFIDCGVDGSQNQLPAKLIALSTLRCLRSVFISIDLALFTLNSHRITPEDREDIRLSLDAIAEQGLLEVFSLKVDDQFYLREGFLCKILQNCKVY